MFLFLSYPVHSQYLQSLKLKNTTPALTDKSKPYRSGGNAFAAGALSLILPGLALGQIYNGDWEQFSTHITITAACFTGVFISAVLLTHNGANSLGWTYVLLGTTLVYTGNWIWSIIDAASTADKMEREKQLKNHSLIDMLRFGFSFQNKTTRLNFSLNL
jgi:hypothetical protein